MHQYFPLYHMKKILVYSPKFSPRLDYVLKLVFEQQLGLEIEKTQDSEIFIQANLPKLNYSLELFSIKNVHIPSHSLLFESQIFKQSIEFIEFEGMPALFPVKNISKDLPFDLLAFIFYHSSRYEEYLPFDPDVYGRFNAQKSFAHKFRMLDRPILEEWVIWLGQKLRYLFPKLEISKPIFTFQPTYDIDLAWAYLHRSWYRSLGGITRELTNLQIKSIKHRLAVYTGRQIDPFYTFDHLDAWHKKYQLEPTYFFLLGDPGPIDRNINPKNKAFRELIKGLASKASIGIHPSGRSNDSVEQLQKEIDRLAQITGTHPIHSRQHYLILRFPETYQRLLKCGITHDYSLGYAAQIGFRAGLSRPFYWYDLSKETQTNLLLHPFPIMDASLKHYMLLEPDEALQQSARIVEYIKKTNGTFSLLWHNSSFSVEHGWLGWHEMYEKLLTLAVKQNNVNDF